MGIGPDQDIWEILEAHPGATHDSLYGDDDEDDDDGNDSNDDTRDTCLQLEKMIVTERLGGLFRPQYTSEVRFDAPHCNLSRRVIPFPLYGDDSTQHANCPHR